MPALPDVSFVGAGNLGSALALSLRALGYRIREVVHRDSPASARRARALARRLGARAVSLEQAELSASLVWITVPDDAIAACARRLSLRASWKGKVVFHSSGALPSRELAPLARRGARMASVHPMQTFVRGVRPDLRDVLFTLEGDEAALSLARRIVRDFGAESFPISRAGKSLYHAAGSLASPLTVATLALAERTARAAGLPAAKARQALVPIVRRTLENYLRHGPAAAFSGPIVRGDLETVCRHLRALRRLPYVRRAYIALAYSALHTLPVAHRARLRAILDQAGKKSRGRSRKRKARG